MKTKKRVADDIIQGLNEIIEYKQGKRKLHRRHVEIATLPEYKAHKVKSIRGKLNLSQNIFALTLGVSAKTIEAWEAGSSEPIGPARRMLALIEQDNTFLEKNHIISNCSVLDEF
jgi:putative transcriptional regulator